MKRVVFILALWGLAPHTYADIILSKTPESLYTIIHKLAPYNLNASLQNINGVMKYVFSSPSPDVRYLTLQISNMTPLPSEVNLNQVLEAIDAGPSQKQLTQISMNQSIIHNQGIVESTAHEDYGLTISISNGKIFFFEIGLLPLGAIGTTSVPQMPGILNQSQFSSSMAYYKSGF